MKKEIVIYNMVFEVPRDCNKRCIHCLRGEKENVHMTQRIAEEALRDVTCITTLTFTGGEPTLNVDVIRDIIHHIIRNEIYVGNFFIVLNGTNYSESLVEVLYDLYDYIRENHGDEELATLAISDNQFQHPDYDVLEMYSKLPFYKDYKESKIKESDILNTGLAAKNNIEKRKIEVEKLHIENSDYQIEVNDGQVYVGANGDIVPCCELSYKDQEQYKLGNVLEESLSEILARNSNL